MSRPVSPEQYEPSWQEPDQQDPDDDTCTDCGRELSRPGRCFDCQVEDSYVGGLAPRFGAQP